MITCSVMDEAAVYTWMFQFSVFDTNDNCPVINSNYEFEPIPALNKQPIIVFSATDADVGVNADFMYFASQLHVEYVVLSTTCSFFRPV